MCGINGINRNDAQAIAGMNQATNHRGPDFSGTYEDDYVSLGHNLLSIRDASDVSKQPWTKPNSPWILLFNGQIYNTREIKKILGSEYQSVDLDTSLLFGLIEKFGWNFYSKIQGMYAIALYNKKEKEIRLYRDPTGQKLLYYYFKDGEFIFSSEIKSILEHKTVDREVDPEAVLIATSLGYIPGTKTLFKHIKKLNISECVQFNLVTKKIRSEYVQSDSGHFSGNFGDVMKQLIEEHLQSKQKIAINLSGGLDSSLLAHEMSALGHTIHSYTTIFDDAPEKYNTDALISRKFSKDYNTDHHEIIVNKQTYFDNFIKSYEAIEEPNYNISLPIYLQTAAIEGIHGDNNRVVLSGDGGDEVFGGYSYYFKGREIGKYKKLLTPLLFSIIKNYRNHTDFNFSSPEETWLFFKFFTKQYIEKDLKSARDISKAYIRNIVEPLGDLYKTKTGPVYDLMFVDRMTWLSGENFIRSDKLYMRESLEMRSPLAYHPLRTYIDRELKESDYLSETTNKAYLRTHYDKLLPSYVVHRKDKSGWRAPIAEWYDKKFKDLFLSLIPNKNSGLIDWLAVRTLIETNETWPGKYSHLYLSLAILKEKYNIDL